MVKNKTKDDLIKENIYDNPEVYIDPYEEFPEKQVEKCMDEYAETIAIEFDKWWVQQEYMLIIDNGNFYYIHKSLPNETPKTLFKAFIKQYSQ